MAPKKTRFYSQGLRFQCVECGQCCSQPGGYVRITEAEAANIADYLNLSEAEFLDRFAHVIEESDHLLYLDSLANGDCIFLKENRCTIYPVRPLQCRTYPFWPENVKSPYRWSLTARACPGINQGRLYSAQEIEMFVNMMKWNGNATQEDSWEGISKDT
ncbi:MAG: YkgJ family cysteine cluster protein [Calditrichaeota bacterium]|nr:MAG: YkgJ family cysteine cluster protein [Calditrichota bacterium]